jgi:hypothetical protein
MRLKSFPSLTSEEAHNFLMDSASLLDWVEELGLRTNELLSQLTVQTDEEASAVKSMNQILSWYFPEPFAWV